VSLPRLGFLGLGWIGRHRLAAVVEAGVAEVAGLADVSADAAEAALGLARTARRAAGLDDLLALGVDGVVIATPSAQHAEQCERALAAGAAVFCQKPLGRSAAEAGAVVAAARAANRRLGVDFSYRHARAVAAVRDLVRDGTLGDVYAVDLTFHNAYGPDKDWFYDARTSGGGCLMDLGVHLLDFVDWTFDSPIVAASASLFARGRPFAADGAQVEDYATAALTLGSGASVRLACSWRLPLGRDAQIRLAVYGTRGGAACENVGGSFYDFVAERYDGTRSHRLVEPPDAWGGRAAVAWARALADGTGFDPAIESAVRTAAILDGLYGRLAGATAPPAHAR
jgi:predicted dehydrogenase